MQVVFDNTFLALLLHPTAKPPLDPDTRKPVERCQERIEHLVESLQHEGARILIPTPVLAEFLVLAGRDGSGHLDDLTGRSAAFRIEPFDQLAAVELAALELTARSKGDKRSGTSAPWQKVKFDRQIVAIAKTRNAACVYSDDRDVVSLCERAGLRAIGVNTLPLPPPKDQALPFETENS